MRKLLLRAAHFLDVFGEFVGVHAPFVKVVAAHGGMVGKSDFRQAERDGAGGIFDRLAACMMAKRRVHVIIGRQRHEARIT